jgi:AcrR family transcriptional regulator
MTDDEDSATVIGMVETPDTPGRSAARTRERLIDAALDAFAACGYDGVSARQIERRAGVERGLVAYHFGSKQQLWNEAIDSIFKDLQEELRSLRHALRDISSRERARALLMAYTRFTARRPEHFRIWMIEGHVKTERSERLADQLMRNVELFRDVTQISGPVQTDDAIAIYQTIGAAGTLFASSAYSETMFGTDIHIHDPGFVDRFAEALAAIGLHEGAVRPARPDDRADVMPDAASAPGREGRPGGRPRDQLHPAAPRRAVRG